MMEDTALIQQRNARVEVDKAWERSLTRRGLIAIATYVVIGGYLSFLGIEGAWLHAVVPAVAYILSTLCLSQIKPLWVENIYRKKEVSS